MWYNITQNALLKFYEALQYSYYSASKKGCYNEIL